MSDKNLFAEEQETLMQEQSTTDLQNLNKRKKTVKIILIVCAAIVALYALFMILIPEDYFAQQLPPIPIDENIKLYPPDWESDIMNDSEYAQMDYRVHYYDVDSGAIYSLEKEDLPSATPEIRFFYYYFEAIRLGDAERYAEFFSPDYDGAYEIPESFTEQMVYDIYIEPYTSDNEAQESYKVFYKIARNNGTFRQDIGEIGGVDVGCDLMFVLTFSDNGFSI